MTTGPRRLAGLAQYHALETLGPLSPSAGLRRTDMGSPCAHTRQRIVTRLS